MIDKRLNGNIIGIYYFHNYKQLLIQEDNMDLCDCYLQNYKIFDTYNINNIIDVGDMDKLNATSTYITRSFNKIVEINETRLKKYAIGERGKEIIGYEQNWYKVIDFNVPIIYEYGSDYFIMEKLINYIPLYIQFSSNNIETNNRLLTNIHRNYH